MSTSASPRVNYDAIAQLYDAQPYREKTVDVELTAFLASRSPNAALTVLDLGCGTGNQLVANQMRHPGVHYLGVDRFLGMLRQAQPKSWTIGWVQADSASPPFRSASADFITSQYMFHHVSAKAAMLVEVFRVLRPGGRFVLTNLCPQAAPDGLLYQYFPAAWDADQVDFWSPEQMDMALRQIGFQSVSLDLQHLRFSCTLGEFLATVQRRDTCSQLLTIADAAYANGLQRLDIAARRCPRRRFRRICVS